MLTVYLPASNICVYRKKIEIQSAYITCNEYYKHTRYTHDIMDKLMSIILPTDVWDLSTNYLFEHTYLKYIVPQKYKYVLNTFAKNIDYISNDNLLKPTESYIELNIGMIKYLHNLNKLSIDKTIYNKMFRYAINNKHYSTVKYLMRTFTHADLHGCEIIYAIESVCNNGNLDMLTYLIETLKITNYNAIGNISNAFIFAGANGHVKVLKYLARTFGVTQKNMIHDDNNVFILASKNGHLDTLKYLTKTFKLSQKHAITKENSALRHACKHGHLKILKYLTRTFKLDREDATSVNNDAFIGACCNGHLGVLKYLTNTFKITHEDVMSNDNSAFILASANGHLEVLKYLTETFGITREEALINKNRAFLFASANGHLEVLRYLTDTFELSQKHAMSCENYAFRHAGKNGHLEILKYLRDTFKLDKEDAISYNYYVFRNASINGHLETLAYLTKTFGLTRKDVLFIDNFLYECVGHLKILQYLKETFELTRNDIICDNNCVIRSVCKIGNLEILKYLVEAFKITREDVACAFKLVGRHSEMFAYLTETFGGDGNSHTERSKSVCKKHDVTRSRNVVDPGNDHNYSMYRKADGKFVTCYHNYSVLAISSPKSTPPPKSYSDSESDHEYPRHTHVFPSTRTKD